MIALDYTDLPVTPDLDAKMEYRFYDTPNFYQFCEKGYVIMTQAQVDYFGERLTEPIDKYFLRDPRISDMGLYQIAWFKGLPVVLAQPRPGR